jgi:hypothetical protein
MKLLEPVQDGDEPLGFTDIVYRCDRGRIIIRFFDGGKIWMLDTRTSESLETSVGVIFAALSQRSNERGSSASDERTAGKQTISLTQI